MDFALRHQNDSVWSVCRRSLETLSWGKDFKRGIELPPVVHLVSFTSAKVLSTRKNRLPLLLNTKWMCGSMMATLVLVTPTWHRPEFVRTYSTYPLTSILLWTKPDWRHRYFTFLPLAIGALIPVVSMVRLLPKDSHWGRPAGVLGGCPQQVSSTGILSGCPQQVSSVLSGYPQRLSLRLSSATDCP